LSVWPVKEKNMMDAPKNLTNEYFILWIMVAQTKDAVLKARQRDYAQFGINNERRAVLWSIQNNGGEATPVEISRQLFRELHSVTEMLNRMSQEGLLQKFDGSGKSKTVVRLSPKGLDVLNQSLHNQTDEKIFSILSKKEREKFMQYLWKVRNKALHELGIPEWRIKFPLDPNDSKNNVINHKDNP
jgi:DNA-binding MarR family transcriptional regulator